MDDEQPTKKKVDPIVEALAAVRKEKSAKIRAHASKKGKSDSRNALIALRAQQQAQNFAAESQAEEESPPKDVPAAEPSQLPKADLGSSVGKLANRKNKNKSAAFEAEL